MVPPKSVDVQLYVPLSLPSNAVVVSVPCDDSCIPEPKLHAYPLVTLGRKSLMV